MVIWDHFMHESINTLCVMLKYQIPIKNQIILIKIVHFIMFYLLF